MKSRKLKGTVIGLPQVLAIILFIVVIVIALDLITPYIGLRGPGITERIIYKLKELFMMPIPDMVIMYHFEGGAAARVVIEDSSWHGNEAELK
ncbi:MAG: hypothetical protein QMD14_05385, partial [Candidatus Aenigmarchaeota archaeon]|nr:hypothetical protein [Candidatus Aenigmarchaeota archaeon]